MEGESGRERMATLAKELTGSRYRLLMGIKIYRKGERWRGGEGKREGEGREICCTVQYISANILNIHVN